MTSMLELVEEIPVQLRWTADLQPPPIREAPQVIVAGMGGSGIAGDVAAVVAEEAGIQLTVHKDYGLPAWSTGEELIVLVSHSGDTEETMSAADATLATGGPAAAVTTGGGLARLAAEVGLPAVIVPPGPQPRAAFGYLVGAVLRVLEAAGLIEEQAPSLREAAAVVEGLLRGDGPAIAEEVASAILGRFTVVYGGRGVAGVAANRWKTQINENAKAPAAWALLPEADHNDIVGWGALADLTREAAAAVFLRDRDDHPRTSLRVRLTGELIADAVRLAGTIESRGESTIARLFSLAVIGDLVSVALADQSGIDPMPVDVIEDLKSHLAQESP